MLCFLCNENHDDFKTLIFHFKVVHLLQSNSSYKCCQPQCDQNFSNLKSFKKHATKKHALGDLCTNTTVYKNATDRCSSAHNSYKNTNILQPDKPKCSQNVPKLSKTFDLQNYLKEITISISQFALSLHKNSNFSRKDVYEIIGEVQHLIIRPFTSMIKLYADSNLRYEHISIYNDIMSILTNYENAFQHCSTEHKFNKFLKESEVVNEITEFQINSEIGLAYHSGSLSYGENQSTGILMPLRFQFKKFFEARSLLNVTIKHMNQLEKRTQFTNFVQGDLWKKKKDMYPDRILIPYFLYSDDIELNNPLGAHAATHSVCNIYYSFPSLPTDAFKLENIFLAGVVKTRDIKEFRNNSCFRSLVNELISLEECGIEIIDDDNKSQRVYFVLGLILGDNLGLNTILDFKKSFSSHSYCRFCRASKQECNKLYVEDHVEMRNIKNYEEDIYLETPRETGIEQYCIFNDIPSFHVVENFSVDVMHDLFEGVCHYDLCQIISYFVYKMKYLDLETLNIRKQNFQYGPIEIDNISGEIKKSHLLNKHLKMSASEMMCFIIYFPIMIGDLIPTYDEVWKFLLNLVEIVNLLLSFEVSNNYITHLAIKISKHNQNYTQLFNDSLKPKFHNLIHYPTVIRKSGPLRNLWCFKFEAKHKEFKLYAHAITSRKNICLTFAKKFELKFAYQILFTKQHRMLEYNECNKIITNYSKLISENLKISSDVLKYFKKICFKGIEYRAGFYVSTYYRQDVELHEIITIVLREDNSVILFCQKLNQIEFHPHILSFEINTRNVGTFTFLEIGDISGPPFTLIKTAKGKYILRFNEAYNCSNMDEDIQIHSGDYLINYDGETSYTVLNGNHSELETMVDNNITEGEEDGKSEELLVLLREWKLEMLFDQLSAEKVTIDILKIISPRFVDRLLYKYPLGIQALFDYQLEQWRKHNKILDAVVENSSNESTKVLAIDRPTSSSRFSPYNRPETPDDNVTLADILNDTIKGNMIMEYYNKKPKFEDEQRSLLINIICQYYNNRSLHMSLGKSKRLEQEICDRFPSEKLEYYREGKRGKIYNRCCNQKTSLKLICINDTSEDIELTKELSPEPNSEICERSLKFDNLSAEEFDRAWQACSKHRLHQISTLASTYEIMQKWPFYKQPNGFRLIDMDFIVMFNKQTGILEKWDENVVALTNFLYKDGTIKDKNIISVLQRLKQNVNTSENNRNAALLWSIHGYLVPTQKTIIKYNAGKKSTIKYTIRDSQDSFVFIGKCVQELEDHIQFLKSKTSNIQPFIMLIGSSILNIEDCLVYFDGIKFRFTSFLRGVDICFKIFQLFNLEYPLAATNFYILIGELFYNMKNTKVTKNTKINVLLDEILSVNK